MARSSQDSVGEEHSYLLTRSSLNDFLTFAEEYSADEDGLNRGDQATHWKAAAVKMAELQDSERGRADGAVIRTLPANLVSHARAVEADPIFQRAFNDAEYEIGMIDLDRVIISQKLVSLKHVDRLRKQLGSKPSADELFRFCLPYDRRPPEFRVSRIDSEEFAFTSNSNDLRFQEAVLLKPDQVTGYSPIGPIAGVVALVVGFGSNYLNVLSINGRLVLNNGNHRACALWRMGIREVPCIVQTISHPDEIEVHAPRAIQRNPQLYLTDARPPLLGDYFDAVLSRNMRLALTTKQVRLSYSVEQKDMP